MYEYKEIYKIYEWIFIKKSLICVCVCVRASREYSNFYQMNVLIKFVEVQM